MAEDKAPEEQAAEPKPSTKMTLEQALLAPLDSILKAQLHSARSFLNMLLQLGYPHDPKTQEADEGTGSNQPKKLKAPEEPYNLSFAFKDEDNKKQILKVPALALVPISPLAVESAQFELEMSASEIHRKNQIRSSESESTSKEGNYNAQKRPWFLVEEPLDISGEITRRQSSDSSTQDKSIKINIQVKSIPMPAGLEKLISTLTSMSEIQALDDKLVKPDTDNKQEDNSKT